MLPPKKKERKGGKGPTAMTRKRNSRGKLGNTESSVNYDGFSTDRTENGQSNKQVTEAGLRNKGTYQTIEGTGRQSERIIQQE